MLKEIPSSICAYKLKFLPNIRVKHSIKLLPAQRPSFTELSSLEHKHIFLSCLSIIYQNFQQHKSLQNIYV